MIKWNEAPKDYPIWIESLMPGQPSTWHREEPRQYVDECGAVWSKPEEGYYIVHYRPALVEPPVAEWDGFSPPPVGTKCEFNHPGVRRWIPLEVFAYTVNEYGSVILGMTIDSLWEESGGACCIQLDFDLKFRKPEGSHGMFWSEMISRKLN